MCHVITKSNLMQGSAHRAALGGRARHLPTLTKNKKTIFYFVYVTPMMHLIHLKMQ
jgi:hypothetical protein